MKNCYCEKIIFDKMTAMRTYIYIFFFFFFFFFFLLLKAFFDGTI